ncbi:hypothetical protein [Streptomyces sp. Midd1]|uniref:hypothetical protein n=1 Tax=Streptomyces sp. Midd3 TaxID=3161191 RepID=UPI0034DB2303
MTEPTPPADVDLLRRAESYLSALHGSVARHDNLAANFRCAGCELRDQITATLLVAATVPVFALTDQAADDRLRCPQCAEDITDYSEDDHVHRTGDERPFCSGECVVAAHRSVGQRVSVADRAAILLDGASHLARQADELWAAGTTAHTVMLADADELRRWAATTAGGRPPLPSISEGDIEGWCPACGHPTLMVEAGRLTCTLMGCPRPEAAARLLQGVAAALAGPALTSTPDGWDLADVEAREAAATRGPWRVERDEQKLTRLVVSDDGMLHADLGYLGNCNQADAEFTAHAREDVPQLIALVRAFHLDWAQALFKIHADADLRETEGQTELAAYARELATLITSSELSAEETDTRVTDLYERWVKAGPPPLGASLARWWDARLIELRNAIRPVHAERQPAVVSEPDGSPPA